MKIQANANGRKLALPAPAKHFKIRHWRYLDRAIVVAMSVLLYCGASWQIFHVHTDAAKYECYAVAFWRGVPALHQFPEVQCDFITKFVSVFVKGMRQMGLPSPLINFVAAQPTTAPFHALPHEYPLLTLIPFSLALIVPSHWYQVAFAVWMALVGVFIYYVLLRNCSRRVALPFAFYLVVGGWGTAEGRFDLIPSALTLLAIMYAVRKRWHWAFFYLALGTLFKFYPAILLIPFLITQQMESREDHFSWRSLLPLGTFVGVCATVTMLSLLLSVEGTLAPLSYFQGRPVQIESASATVLWLFSFLGYHLHPVFSFGSLNILSPLSPIVSVGGSIVLVLGLGYIYWLQWRRKLDLAAACLLTLLIIMFTGKVFSPQYLIWVAPLVAYVGMNDPRWLVSWGAISALTSYIYPFIYNMGRGLMDVPNNPLFFPVAAVRNGLLFLFILALLVYYSRRPEIDTVLLSLPEYSDQMVIAGKK
jgi:hypothetical protein